MFAQKSEISRPFSERLEGPVHRSLSRIWVRVGVRVRVRVRVLVLVRVRVRVRVDLPILRAVGGGAKSRAALQTGWP